VIRPEPYDLKLAAIAQAYANKLPELPQGRTGVVTVKDLRRTEHRVIYGVLPEEAA
jgi:hypothetical protein